jgi:hypothetical protein
LSKKYDEAVQVIEGKEEQIQQLNAQILDLEQLKDKKQVRLVRQKYSTKDEEFSLLCEEARAAVEVLGLATRLALFYEQRNEPYMPDDREDWDAVNGALAVQEIDHSEAHVYPNHNHPRVRKAQNALNELQRFLGKNEKFVEELEDEHKFPMNTGNKEFWRKYLSRI